jgi:hypothetical protein
MNCIQHNSLVQHPEWGFSSVKAFHFEPKKKDLHCLQDLKGPQDLQNRHVLQELAASRRKIQYMTKNTRTPGGTLQQRWQTNKTEKNLRSSTCPLTSFFWLLSHVIYLKLTRLLSECLLCKMNEINDNTYNYTKKNNLALGNLAKLIFWLILSFKNFQD